MHVSRVTIGVEISTLKTIKDCKIHHFL